jgi:hypothetical protein
MNTTTINRVRAFTLIVLALAIAAMGIYVAEADDAPGAGGLGLILMAAGVVLGVRAARGRLPVWASRAALIAGLVIAAFAAALTHGVAVSAPFFPAAQEVPSIIESAPPPAYAAAAARARDVVRAAMMEQRLPGVSVAVASGGGVVWAEGFGWRDVLSQAPVTPKTRFNIGTAAPTVTAAAARLGLTDTGADPVADWSPSHLGEPEDDFPPFTLIRHIVFRPLGLAPDWPLPGNRATFYVPRYGSNPAGGHREMYMRDMACCATRMAFYSTPSDLARFALAATPTGLEGRLAGGTVMSLATRPDHGVAVAVTSNLAFAATSSLAQRVADAFAGPPSPSQDLSR